MSICTLIYDHLAVVSIEFCLRLRCWTLSKVVKKLVAVSPGSVIAIWNNSYFFYGWNIELITPGQATAISSVMALQLETTLRIAETTLLVLSRLSPLRRKGVCNDS
jgi:hypothetical protein